MLDKPVYNLHSHTFRCGHAIGDDEDYVKAAIDAGYEELGFSDHVMLPWAGQHGIRGEYIMLENYLFSVNQLKRRYASKIRIYAGFEAEWYGERRKEYYESLLRRSDFDYLILGQHCFFENGAFHWYGDLPYEEAVTRYTDDLIEGMRSGLFTVVAHPDLYVGFGHAFGPLAIEAAERIAIAAKETGIPLEVNCAPMRNHPIMMLEKDRLLYPVVAFWDIIAKHDVPVVIGVDAHRPDDYRINPYSFFMRFIERRGLRLLWENPLKPKKR